MARRRRRSGCNARAVLGCLAVVVWLDTIGFAGVYGGAAWLLAVAATVALLALLIVPSWRRQRAAQAYFQMLRDANIDRIDEMPVPEFEEALRLLFEDLGYQASLTPGWRLRRRPDPSARA